MNKEKALLILKRLIENLEDLYTDEMDNCLEASGFWRGDVKEALKYIERLHE